MIQNWFKQKLLALFIKTNGIISQPLFGGLGFILCFHRILPKEQHSLLFGNQGMAVSPEYLEWLICFFKKKQIDIISMDEMYRRFTDKDFSRRFAVITFDDGYADNLTYGLPIFEKYNVPFTIYVSLNMPNGTMIRWWDMLENKLLATNKHSFKFPNHTIEIKAETIREKVAAWWQIREEIIALENKLSRDDIFFLFEFNEEKNKHFTQSIALSYQQIKTSSNHPLVTIGAHTMNHLPLRILELEQAAFEIKESKTQLEKICGKKINHFAYPYGSINECGKREFELVKQAQYLTGVTFQAGNIFKSNKTSLYSLPRYACGDYISEEKLNHILNGVKHFSEI